MAIKTSIDYLASAVERELELYSDNVRKAVRTETDKAMRKLVQETKATAPVGHRHRHYKDHISSKVTMDSIGRYEKTWYVTGSDYRLSHLLEKGHALRDGGRTAGTHFIMKASVSILEDYFEAIHKAVQNG